MIWWCVQGNLLVAVMSDRYVGGEGGVVLLRFIEGKMNTLAKHRGDNETNTEIIHRPPPPPQPLYKKLL